MKMQYSKMHADVGTIGAGPAASNPPAEAPADDTDSPVNWDALSDDSLTETPPGAEPPEAPETPAAPAPAPVAAPVQPATTAQPVAPVQPTVQVPPQDQQAAAKANREAMRAELESIYTNELDEDTRSALLASPETVMPKLMAKAVMDAAQLAMSQFAAVAPRMMQEQTTAREGARNAWGEFHKAHPDLNKPEYQQVLASAVQTVKSTSQKQTKDEAMASVARVARAIIGLPQPGTPGAPAASAPVAPHVPVARGGSAPRASAKPESNPWLEMIREE